MSSNAQYGADGDEGERGDGDVNERKLRRRAKREQRQGEQNQKPVRQAPHRSIPVGAGFRGRAFCNISFKIDTRRTKNRASETGPTPRHRSPAWLCLNSWPQRGGLIREI